MTQDEDTVKSLADARVICVESREEVRNDFENTIRNTRILLIRTTAICIALLTSSYMYVYIYIVFSLFLIYDWT